MRKEKGPAEPETQRKAVPPPDDPLLRHDKEESDLDQRAMAEKRLEAIKQMRRYPGSPEEPKT